MVRNANDLCNEGQGCHSPLARVSVFLLRGLLCFIFDNSWMKGSGMAMSWCPLPETPDCKFLAPRRGQQEVVQVQR